MKNILAFENFEMNEKVNPKKQFGLTTQVQNSIKKLCEGMIHNDAVKCHENDDKTQTYSKYIKECGSYMNECMNECMEVYRNGKNTAGTY
jgi:SMC interacting uncharacterized protein involved in chromosome segregation